MKKESDKMTKPIYINDYQEDITAAELKELEQKIQSAEDEVLHLKKQYDSALEKLSKLLDRRDEIRRGLDGGRVTLKKWSYTWEGNTIWDNGSGTTDCNYQAQMIFRTKGAVPHGKEILKLKTENPALPTRMSSKRCSTVSGANLIYNSKTTVRKTIITRRLSKTSKPKNTPKIGPNPVALN